MGKTPEEKAAKKARKLAEAAAAADAEAEPAPKKAKKDKNKDKEELSEAEAKAAKKAAKKAKKEPEAAAAAAEEEEPEAAPAPKAEAVPTAPAAGADGVKSVFCTNLAWSIDDDALKAHFKDAGEITSINWINDRDTGRFKGMGVAEFATAEQAAAAVAAKNETEVAGRTMYCRLDNPKPKSDRPPREARPLKPKPDGGCKLYCGNLSYQIDDDKIRAFFDPITINSIRWVTDRESGQFKGCGFIECGSTEEADQAIAKQGESCMGRPIRLDWAEDKPKRDY